MNIGKVVRVIKLPTPVKRPVSVPAPNPIPVSNWPRSVPVKVPEKVK